MPIYNITRLKAALNSADIVSYANDSTEGVLMGFVLISIFFILLFIMRRWDFDKSILAASFSCFILGLILTYVQWLNFMVMLFFLFVTALSGLYVYFSRR